MYRLSVLLHYKPDSLVSNEKGGGGKRKKILVCIAELIGGWKRRHLVMKYPSTIAVKKSKAGIE